MFVLLANFCPEFIAARISWGLPTPGPETSKLPLHEDKHVPQTHALCFISCAKLTEIAVNPSVLPHFPFPKDCAVFSHSLDFLQRDRSSAQTLSVSTNLSSGTVGLRSVNEYAVRGSSLVPECISGPFVTFPFIMSWVIDRISTVTVMINYNCSNDFTFITSELNLLLETALYYV